MPNPPHQKNIVHGNITVGGNVRIGDDYITYHNYFAAQEVKIPHRLTNNIPTNADHILGRATELAQAKDHLAQHQATILFNGIGGIGKTALASKYMALHGAEYNHLAWVTVQSTLAEAFTNNAPLLASLQITQQVQDYIEAKQLDKAFEYLFHQLNLLESTLVVIDNANDLDDLDQYKNWFDTANSHFLITSRSQPSEWATIEVDSLPEAEAVALFRKLHPSVSADDDAIKNLLSKLFYHTLLIELVAKAGASTGITFADLQIMIETQFIHHQSLNEAPVPTGKHGSVVPTNLKKAKIEDYIWLIFSQVKGLGDNSKQLLKVMALLPVATSFDLDFLKVHFAFFNIPNAIVNLDALIQRGWLQKEQAEGQKPYIKIHPLIADVVVKHLEVDVEFANNYIKHTSNLIYYEIDNPKHNLFQINKNKQYAERLTELFFYTDVEEISELLHNLNWLNQNFGLYGKAINQGERALQIAENIFTIDHEKIIDRQGNLALAYRALGKYEDARILLEAALASLTRQFNSEYPKIAICQNNLAFVHRSLGQYDIAADYLENALLSDIKNFGEEHPTVILKQSNLALVYKDLGQYERAAALLEAALEFNFRIYGMHHPRYITCQANLGDVYRNLEQYDRAMYLLETAYENEVKNFGIEHPEVSTIQNKLAWVYYNLARFEEAKSLWSKAYKNSLKNLGESHPNTINYKQYLNF